MEGGSSSPGRAASATESPEVSVAPRTPGNEEHITPAASVDEDIDEEQDPEGEVVVSEDYEEQVRRNVERNKQILDALELKRRSATPASKVLSSSHGSLSHSFLLVFYIRPSSLDAGRACVPPGH